MPSAERGNERMSQDSCISSVEEEQKGISRKALVTILLLVILMIVAYKMLGHTAATSPATYSIYPTLDSKIKTIEHDFEPQGFRGIPWGADESNINQILGSDVVRLSNTMKYHNSHVDLIIPQYSVGGVLFEARFQMDDNTSGLIGVLLIRRADSHPKTPDRTFEKDYSTLKTLLTQKLGASTAADKAEIKWAKGDTLIKLDYFFQIGIDDQLTVHFLPH